MGRPRSESYREYHRGSAEEGEGTAHQGAGRVQGTLD